MEQWHATTVIGVRRDGMVALGGDGQVTVGNTVMKQNAVKIRRLAEGRVLAGFAGAVSDAFTLFDRFEGKLNEFNKSLVRAAVELGKEWRTDKYLRNLEALLAVCDAETSLIVAGAAKSSSRYGIRYRFRRASALAAARIAKAYGHASRPNRPRH